MPLWLASSAARWLPLRMAAQAAMPVQLGHMDGLRDLVNDIFIEAGMPRESIAPEP